MSGMMDEMAPEPEMAVAVVSETADQPEAMRRQTPQPDMARAALVDSWSREISRARDHHKPAFDRMREDMDFTWGRQWPEMKPNEAGKLATQWTDTGYYTANICQRHVQQRVAALYARNPRPSVRIKDRLLNTVWDGTPVQLAKAAEALAMGVPDPMAQAIVQDYEAALQRRQQATAFGRTLELLLQHFVGEQAIPFKSQMKTAVRRAVTTGVAYVKLGFQREMETRPDVEARINDISTRLATLERLSAELADNRKTENDAEAEQLRLALNALTQEREVVVREGLVFDFPPSSSILVDPRCRQLRGFVGASWVAQEYVMTPEEVMEVYGIDVRAGGYDCYHTGDGYKYAAGKVSPVSSPAADPQEELGMCRVYEIYSRKDGLVYHYCEGYPDFLKEPSAPPFFLERFWPWIPLVFNEVEHPTELFPPSDIRLIRDMQMEMNRARQGLREHRRAGRPKVAAPAAMLDEEDREALMTHPDDGIAIIELNALQPGQNVKDVLQPITFPGIDQNLYSVEPVFDDILRVVGAQEANLGPSAGGGTATESAIAESSRMSALSASVDELDDILSETARGSAQILLSQLTEDTVKKIVGPGAVWPQMTREEIAAELTVQVEAGSTGRPNKAARISEFQSVAPFLLQTPGVRPDKLLAYQLRLLDDGLDLADFMDQSQPSIMAMNVMNRPTSGDPGTDPRAQGPQGAQGQTPPPQEPEQGGVPNLPRPQVNGMARRFLS